MFRKLTKLIGLAGVSRMERPAARRWGHFFEAPMLVLAIWIVIEWYLIAQGAYPFQWGVVTHWVIWWFFVFETTLLLCLVRDRSYYLRTNWINVLIDRLPSSPGAGSCASSPDEGESAE